MGNPILDEMECYIPEETVITDLQGNEIKPEPFYYGLIPYLWLKYVKKKDVHFIGWRY